MKILRNSADYPNLLGNIENPPEQLFYHGQKSLLHKICIAFVGTRRSSTYGKYITEKLISEIAHLDIVIVSGLAHGIDTIAHKAALQHDLPTIAVLACGLDPVYPSANIQLARQITHSGLLISENPNNTPAHKFHFPRRNRIISGLSLLTIVVQAPEKSGALITAHYALKQGRDIATIPADIDRQSFWGNLKLLQNGAAYPISCGQDIIGLLQTQPTLFPQKKVPDLLKLSQQERQVFDLLSPVRATGIDTISSQLKKPIQAILVTLSILEMHGLIKNHAGKYLKSS